jgi:hypothetical protein
LVSQYRAGKVGIIDVDDVRTLLSDLPPDVEAER